MKVKAKTAFVDKYTEKVYAPGDVIECTEERRKELLADSRKLVEAVEETAEAKAEEKKAEEPAEEKAAEDPKKTTAKKTTTRKTTTAKKTAAKKAE